LCIFGHFCQFLKSLKVFSHTKTFLFIFFFNLCGTRVLWGSQLADKNPISTLLCRQISPRTLLLEKPITFPGDGGASNDRLDSLFNFVEALYLPFSGFFWA
jgi:hypothetical protein